MSNLTNDSVVNSADLEGNQALNAPNRIEEEPLKRNMNVPIISLTKSNPLNPLKALVELGHVQKEMMSNELEFARIVEEDLNLRNQLFETTLELSHQVDSFMGLFETFMSERNLRMEHEHIRRSLYELCSKEVQTEATLMTTLKEDIKERKETKPKEPILTKEAEDNHLDLKESTSANLGTTPSFQATPPQTKQEEVRSNPIIVDLLFLDMKIRSTMKQGLKRSWNQ
ncbi:hypothetical protein C9374_009779 [Naegleria lovaniensis]|uniref:Uncharacterized protein n=1 Tax=Naegleria lovaniensis TaxID=51637 RepID=A0AA88KRF8_NAELO|nr:uncharacterized protein C9374_009779 [Naegleria lovaniensis]KAG2393202.1 hypothetical protein C9374_009779 [Naegleria lovaniensis]